MIRNILCLFAVVLLLQPCYAQSRPVKQKRSGVRKEIAVDTAGGPAISAPAENDANRYSNNQVATSDNILVTRVRPETVPPAAILKDALIIYATNGSILSWDMEQKKTNWTYKEKEVADNGGNRFSVDGALLYIPFVNGAITALDANTGKTFWADKIGLEKNEALLTGQAAPISGDKVFIAARNNNLYAIDKRTGAMVWNYRLEYPYNIYSPLLVNDALFINNAPYIYKFIAESGQAIWQRGFSKAMYSAIVSDGRRVYAGDEDKTLYAINPADTSRIDWKFSLEDEQFHIDENLIAGEGVLYLAGKANPGSTASSVYAVRMSDGKKLWRSDLPASGIADLCLSGKLLYGYIDETIFVLDAATGEQMIMIPTEEVPVSNIIAEEDGETMLYLSNKGLVRYNHTKGTFVTTPIPGLQTVADYKAIIARVKASK
ncbi:PQQ-binding-like beta-propeller repeat protein [Taibaiella koreensis]|uniref:PQQ-binding-like beta-propeller repeat protein n=1 Tax=Taibaiella koreensis TaxID=1268548 RepID=UPI000E59CF01|nr:PQQ-binding-like beta-propeller repeat protein [Taibaiella koreensis]